MVDVKTVETRFLLHMAKEYQAKADELQRQAAAAQSKADACRKELKRRKRETRSQAGNLPSPSEKLP